MESLSSLIDVSSFFGENFLMIDEELYKRAILTFFKYAKCEDTAR